MDTGIGAGGAVVCGWAVEEDVVAISGGAADAARACEVCEGGAMVEVRYGHRLCATCLEPIYFEERLGALHHLEVYGLVRVRGQLSVLHRPTAHLTDAECDRAMRALTTTGEAVMEALTDALNRFNESIRFGYRPLIQPRGRNFLRLAAMYLPVIGRHDFSLFVGATASVHMLLRDLDSSSSGTSSRSPGIIHALEIYDALKSRKVGESNGREIRFLESSQIEDGRRLLRALSVVELERISKEDLSQFLIALDYARRVINATVIPILRPANG